MPIASYWSLASRALSPEVPILTPSPVLFRPESPALGEFEARTWITGVVQAIRAVKADQESLRLQNEFYERSKRPLDTRQ